mgnify:CR=1 FL=1
MLIFWKLRCILFINICNISNFYKETSHGKKTGYICRYCGIYTLFQKQRFTRYFNHPDSLTLENQEKISRALDELGYKKNKLAKVLANGKSEFVGIIVPNLYLHYYSEMLTQLLATYANYHYKFLIFMSDKGAAEEENYIDELLAYQIEGLIVLSHTLSSEKLASYHIPIVAIERESMHISSVTSDNYMGALQATSLFNT